MTADQFCLKWNNYQASLTNAFKSLLENEDFVDVTLSAGGKTLRAHKVVLSACSSYFKQLLRGEYLNLENGKRIKLVKGTIYFIIVDHREQE